MRVHDINSIRPLDRDAVRRAAADHGLIVTAEEHNVTGGFGAAVAEVIDEEGLRARLARIGMPDARAIFGTRLTSTGTTSWTGSRGGDREATVAEIRRLARGCDCG